ncbi:SRPBCC family protein [Pseudomonas sp. PDM19]|uniref:SRPBCC family protein n=1 Tax=Pseudomonas sp. PDM19 TaxID=2769272 RepID=UPI00178232A3|nr:SRPBCC family protein [Pseudomonas sp. PDM19]MBD9629435.1 SRPBCC family protein [Pseudomonas sp. PDM19]
MQSNNEVVIKGRVEQVFDLVTQVRFWPRWHLATRAVSGVTERPFQPGDVFYEFVRTSDGAREIEWQVADYERPCRASIQLKGSSLKITYTFEAHEGGTLFRRTLERGADVGISLGSGDSAAQDVERRSVQNLVGLVERLVECEAVGPRF